jgi:hypothetical protein
MRLAVVERVLICLPCKLSAELPKGARSTAAGGIAGGRRMTILV